MSERPTPDSTRRPGVPGVPVRLADGRLWSLARPMVRYSPRFESSLDEFGRPCHSVKVLATAEHPPTILAAIGRLHECCDRGTVSEQAESFLSLASALLTLAHDLDPGTARDLLQVPADALPSLVVAVHSAISPCETKENRGAPS